MNGIKNRIKLTRRDVLITKRIIIHNKRVFNRHELKRKTRSIFEKNPRKEILQIFFTIEVIPCPNDADNLEQFWSEKSKI